MPVPYLVHGPATYQASASIAAGKLVVPDPSNAGFIIQNATAGSTKVLGVAATNAGVRTDQNAQNPVNAAQVPPEVGVYYNVDIPILYSSAAALGQKLVADGAGGVAVYTTGGGASTFDQVVGVCTEPNGVSGSGVTARAWIGR